MSIATVHVSILISILYLHEQQPLTLKKALSRQGSSISRNSSLTSLTGKGLMDMLRRRSSAKPEGTETEQGEKTKETTER